MSHVNPINKLAALLVYWWAKLLNSVAIEECELPVLGIGSIELLGIHFSQLNLQPRILNELWTTYPNKIADVFFHFSVTLFCVWWVPHNVWWGPWVHQTFCLMVHQTFSPTLPKMMYMYKGYIVAFYFLQYAHKLAGLVGQCIHKKPSTKLSDRLFFL